jgi:AcrR family transcriptional regulator
MVDFMPLRIYPSSREKILDAAERVILRDGASKLTVDAVLSAAKVSKGGFFYHFPTKDALLDGLVRRVDDQWLAAVERARQQEPAGPGQFTRALVRSFFDCPVIRDRKSRKLVAALAALSVEHPQLFRRTRQTYQAIFRALEKDGIGLGRALTIFAALDGLCVAQVFGLYRLTARQEAVLIKEFKRLLEPVKGKR